MAIWLLAASAVGHSRLECATAVVGTCSKSTAANPITLQKPRPSLPVDTHSHLSLRVMQEMHELRGRHSSANRRSTTAEGVEGVGVGIGVAAAAAAGSAAGSLFAKVKAAAAPARTAASSWELEEESWRSAGTEAPK
jgi:hypothetical protein